MSYLADGDEEVLVISDFDATRKELDEKLDKELAADAFDIINQGQQHDPDNALYDYLRACVYLELGDSTATLSAIRKASKKKTLNTYFTETRSAVSQVLELAEFPQELQSHITDVYVPVGNIIRGKLWKKGLESMSREYEEQNKITEAAEILQLTRRMAKHIREEPLPYASSYNTGMAQSMEKRADQREKKISDQNN